MVFRYFIWCVPLETYRFNLTAESKGIYTIIIDLDGDLFVVGTTTNKQQCKNKVHHFVGKYKIPVKVLLTEYLSDKEYKFTDKYEYTYESYLQWMAGESEMIKLKTYLYENTDTADVVRQMGWNAKGKFYAFSNGVYKDGEFHAADKFGIVRIPSESDDEQAADHCFFIPAGANTDVECFDDASEGSHALERNFKHRSLDTTSFGTYSVKSKPYW